MSEYPSEWSVRSLGEIAERVRRTSTDQNLDVLTISSTEGWVDQKRKWARDMAGKSIEKYTLLQQGEFSYNRGNSKTYPQGCVFRLDSWDRALVPNVYHSFSITSPDIDDAYLKHFFSVGGLNDQLRSVITSSVRDNGLLNITAETFFASEIPVPPLPEQKKIAEILSGIDHATDSISRRIAKEEALFISLQHELLSDIAGAAFALPRHQDQALKILPVARLFEVQLGKMLNKEAKEHGHQFQYIGNKNVQQWNPDLRQLESMHFSDSERGKFALKPFDLLVCEGGDAGRCCIWERGETEIYYQKAIHRMRPINDDCLPTFMMHYLSYCKANNLLSDFISRTSISHLTREKLLEVPVALPSHQEQSSIVNKLELQRKSISKLFSKSKILKNLKSAVASDLLSGRKRVSV